MAGDWTVDGGRLWGTGVATALVAGLAATTVLFVARSLVGSAVLVAPPGRSPADLSYLDAFLVAFVIGLVATAVLQVLLLVVPRGTSFFAWISTLFLVLSLGPVFAMDVPMESKVWLSALHAVAYAVVVSLLLGAVPRVARRVQP